jgi:intracellular sulfur oxidation DsrE/DsrF family protein
MDRFGFSRRAFVAGAATVAALAAPALAADAPAAPAAASPPPLPGDFYDPVAYKFDARAFAAILDQPFPHRQVVAATSFGEGTAALAFMENTIKAYVDPIYFNAGPKSVHAAAVFYHGASVLLALDDAMWAKYPLGEHLQPAGAAAKPGEKIARTNENAATIAKLVGTYGASFFVCNNALSGIAASFVQTLAPAGTTPTRAQVIALHDEFAAHFLPGVTLVPAGVAAINAAQEARFTYLRA